MNKILFTLLLTTLVFTLGAQTGLFNLSFGESVDDAIAQLSDNGFDASYQDDSSAELVSVDNSLVEKIDLSFDSDDATLIGWSVTYLPQDVDDIESIVMDALVSWHGEDYSYNNDFAADVYQWDLGGGNYVEAGYDSDFTTFWVDYFHAIPDTDTSSDEEY